MQNSDMSNEIWANIELCSGYEISNKGNVRSLKNPHKNLKHSVDRKGYARISITISRKKYTLKIHREVAKAFISNELNLPQVNHKDGNKLNNCVDNLEWMTNQENALHAIQNGLWDNQFTNFKKYNDGRKVKIKAVSIYNGEAYYYDSMSEAERAIGTKHINAVIQGKRSQASGFVFFYAQKEEVMPNATNRNEY